MAEGIEVVREVMHSGIDVMNAQAKLRTVDWKVFLRQVLDLDEAECIQLAQEFKVLELKDDEFEQKLEGMVDQYGPWFPYAMRLLRLVLPKPKPVV